MSNSHNDPTGWLTKLTERFAHIIFPPGVIGKTSHAIIALLILWAIIAFRLPSDVWFILLLAVGLIATGVVIWWVRSTQEFAERNPGQAMLEGAEFLDYYKSEVQAKGLQLPRSPSSTDPDRPPPPPQITDDTADQ
jgi:hypothetical protein